jgi:Ferritin-like domain
VKEGGVMWGLSEARFPGGWTVGERVGHTRGDFLRRTLIAGGILGGGALIGVRPEGADSAPSAKQDHRILTFALRLELLQAAFYEQGAATLEGELLEFAEVVGPAERAHADFLRSHLGGDMGNEPQFEFGDSIRNASNFAANAHLLEETVTAAYVGQGANLTASVIAGFGELTSVEARQAAWISDIIGKNPAPHAADPAMTASEVVAALRGAGFLGQ